MNIQDIKPGMMALAPVRVKFCHAYNIECTTEGVEGVRAEPRSDNKECVEVHASVLLPMPSPDEYRLTKEDLLEACLEFVEYYAGFGEDGLLGKRDGWLQFLQNWHYKHAVTKGRRAGS